MRSDMEYVERHHHRFTEKPRCCFICERPLLDPLGVGYLVSVLRANGYHVDWVFDRYGFMSWRMNNKVRYDNTYLKNLFEQNPYDVVFISSNTDYYRRARDIATTLKTCHPELVVCMGGPHPTFAHRQILADGHVDFVCRGEGEIAIIQLLAYLRGERASLPAGIYTTNDQELCGNGLGELVEDLDQLPFPEKAACYRDLPHIRGLYTIASGRGCYNDCTYCNSPTIRKYYRRENKTFMRRRSVENIMAELRMAREKFDIRVVGFCDDTFIYNRKYMRRFAEQYAAEIGLPFGCQTNPNFFDRETLRMLVDAGLVWVQTGAESLDPYVCRHIFHRREDREDVFRFVRMLKELGVYVRVDQILTPWDSRETFKAQVELYNQLRPSWVNLNYLIYYPEAEIVDKAVEDGHLPEEQRNMAYEGIIPTIMYYGGHLPPEKVRSMKDLALLLNWLPVLPPFLVRFLLKGNRTFFLRFFPVWATTLAARVVNGLLGKKDYIARFHFKQLLLTKFKSRKNVIKSDRGARPNV